PWAAASLDRRIGIRDKRSAYDSSRKTAPHSSGKRAWFPVRVSTFTFLDIGLELRSPLPRSPRAVKSYRAPKKMKTGPYEAAFDSRPFRTSFRADERAGGQVDFAARVDPRRDRHPRPAQHPP